VTEEFLNGLPLPGEGEVLCKTHSSRGTNIFEVSVRMQAGQGVQGSELQGGQGREVVMEAVAAVICWSHFLSHCLSNCLSHGCDLFCVADRADQRRDGAGITVSTVIPAFCGSLLFVSHPTPTVITSSPPSLSSPKT
jgi:hypothetical protein